MPITTIVPVTLGELITVPKMNDQWQGNIDFLLNSPSCRVHNGGTQSIVSGGTLVLLTWDTELYDNASLHSTATNPGRITFSTAGVYDVSAGVGFTRGTDYTQAGILIRLNGATYVVQSVVGTETNNTDEHFWRNAAAPYKFAANDYIECLAFQRNGAAAARNVLATATGAPTFFAASWQGRG